MDRLEEYSLSNNDGSHLQVYRSLSLGASGLCLLIVMLLAQIWKDSSALTVSLYSSASGIPVWYMLSEIYGWQASMGSRAHPYYQSNCAQNILTIFLFIGALSLFVSVGSIIFYLDATALYLFIALSVISAVAGVKYHLNLTKVLGNDTSKPNNANY